MNLVLAAAVIALAVAASVAVMLFVRRRAPEGSYFSDGDRASGVFGVIATGFSVLLGFIVFLAFTTYDATRSAAEAEAVVVAKQVETAQFFDQGLEAELTGELVCYGRTVVSGEWDELQDGTLGDALNPWGAVLFETLRGIEPDTAAQQSAYDRFLDQTLDREEARRDRVHAVVGVIPTPLWVVLFFVTGVIFVFMLFFADRAERAVTQALLMGSVMAVITTLLLLLAFFNRPFQEGVGGLRPDSMERTLVLVDEALASTGIELQAPCDEVGNPL